MSAGKNERRETLRQDLPGATVDQGNQRGRDCNSIKEKKTGMKNKTKGSKNQELEEETGAYSYESTLPFRYELAASCPHSLRVVIAFNFSAHACLQGKDQKAPPPAAL